MYVGTWGTEACMWEHGGLRHVCGNMGTEACMWEHGGLRHVCGNMED